MPFRGPATLLVAVLALCASAPAAPSPQLAADPPHADIPEALRAKLEALTPSEPRAYLELGEDIADTAQDPAALELARRLFVLAMHLDRARGGGRVAASACLALAELAPRERDRRWLESLAGAVDQRSARPGWVRRVEKLASGQAGLNAATALGLVRSGDGVRARQALNDPSAAALLRSYERLLDPQGLTGAFRALDREADRWPCPECHNQRIVRKFGSTRDPQYRLCTNCAGNPGPSLSVTELVAHLRLESQLLTGIQRSWSAQVSADRGAPLRDPDPADVAPAFDVDTAKTVFRNGRWVDPTPAAPPSPAPPAARPESIQSPGAG